MPQACSSGDLDLWLVQLWTSGQINMAANVWKRTSRQAAGFGEVLCGKGSVCLFCLWVYGGVPRFRLTISCQRREKRLFYEHKRLKELPSLPPPPAGGAAQLISLQDCSQQKAALQRAR